MSIIGYLGVEGIVLDARDVIAGISRLFTDENLTSLDVETDDHACGFGKWLYSDDRKRGQVLTPELLPLFKTIEIPHRELHESAIAIKKTLKKDHGDLAQVLSDHIADHSCFTLGHFFQCHLLPVMVRLIF